MLQVDNEASLFSQQTSEGLPQRADGLSGSLCRHRRCSCISQTKGFDRGQGSAVRQGNHDFICSE